MGAERELDMEMIRKYVTQIGELAEELDKLSSRQRMLALNASIEAARAGEAGRGFNIVAKNVEEMSRSYMDLGDRLKDVLHTLDSEIRG